jgi:putative copper export protein
MEVVGWVALAAVAVVVVGGVVVGVVNIPDARRYMKIRRM